MAEIVNLHRFRKARERAREEAKAAANRRKYGRTKAERQESDSLADKGRRSLDAHRLDKAGDKGEPDGA